MQSLRDGYQDTDKLLKCRKKVQQLYSIRSNYEPMWRNLSKYINPYRGRFHEEAGTLNGTRKDQWLLDTYPMRSVHRCSAGLHSGLSSPAQRWFKIGLEDKELEKFHTGKLWLNQVEDVLYRVHAQNNTYAMLDNLYAEMPQFGPGAAMMYQDFNYAVYHKTYTCGEYAAGADTYGRITSFARRMQYNAEQLIEFFGKENVSEAVRTAYGSDDITQKFTVYMLVSKNINYDPYKLAVGNFPWTAYYWEEGAPDKFLKIAGYHEQPFIFARWLLISDEVYGEGAGHTVLGDCMGLQKIAASKLRGVENENDPAMVFPASFKRLDTRPGAKNMVPDGTQMQAYPLIAPGSKRYEGVLATAQDLRQAIREGFFEDLMLMMAQSDRNPQMTAREVAERHQEKLMVLGPILEQFQNEVLQPLTLRTFGICQRNGLFPPMPDELQGVEFKIEFTSLLAQAQKEVSQPGIDKTLAFAGNISGLNPEVLDNIDFDQALRQTADINGAPISILRSEEDVAKMREQRAEAQQQQAEMQQAAAMAEPMKQGAEAARLLSEVNTGAGRNALEAIIGGGL